jgi:hypothetical protein
VNTAGKNPEGAGELPRDPDIALIPDGSGEFYLARAMTERGRSWVQRNIPAAALTPEGDLVIAPHFASDLAAWVRADGLCVRFDRPGG